MPPAKQTLEEKVQDAKRRAEEMKAKLAAKRAAKEASGAAAPPEPTVDPKEEKFSLGEHNLVLIDWDDTLFPTSSWKDRVHDGATHPPRPAKVQALSEAISAFIVQLQQFAEVKLVTHGTKGWYESSSKVLAPATKALLDKLDHRYRDSHGQKYMRKKPAGERYTTDIGVQVDSYGEWFKTDMFFHFISEKKTARKWDEAHLPEKVILPRQVLIIGDGQAEKRSYDEHGNQARSYATRPGHEAVAKVGLKGVFLKDGPSYEELLVQMRWATAHVSTTFLPANDFRTMMWDLTGFPTWVSSIKAGANMYQPIDQGSLLVGAWAAAGAAGGGAAVVGGGVAPMAREQDDEMDQDMQMALAMSMAQGGGGAAAEATTPADTEAQADKAEEDEEERAMKEALALSLS